MNRFFFFLIVLTGVILTLNFHWLWFIPALVALIGSLPLRLRRRSGFWFAFLAAFFTYGAYLTYVQFSNDGLLAGRLAQTFGVGSGWVVTAVAAVWGGLTAGLGGWCGVCLRKAVLGEAATVGD